MRRKYPDEVIAQVEINYGTIAAASDQPNWVKSTSVAFRHACHRDAADKALHQFITSAPEKPADRYNALLVVLYHIRNAGLRPLEGHRRALVDQQNRVIDLTDFNKMLQRARKEALGFPLAYPQTSPPRVVM